LNEIRKKDPEFERRTAEELAAEGRIVRDDLFPDIFARQMKRLSERPTLQPSRPMPFATADFAAQEQAWRRSMLEVGHRAHRSVNAAAGSGGACSEGT
jgi:hypothetical protein